jgi:CelD/BcsL family acetyltransferase involved in cellulose biosynthesis
MREMTFPGDATVERDVSAGVAGWHAGAAPARWQRSVRTIRNAAEFDELAPAWNALAGPDGGPVQRVEWAQSCVATLLPPGAPGLRLITVRRDGQLVALAPLVLRRLRGTPRLEQAGMAETYEPQDLLYADETALGVLLQELLRQREPFALERLPERSRIPALMARIAGRRAWVRVCRQGPYPSLRLDGDPDMRLNAGRRSDLRRALRRAARRGAVRFEVLAPGPDAVDELYATLTRVEAASWKGERRTALVYDARLRAFFHDYARRAAAAGILRIALLHLGTRVAAAQYAVQCGRAWWLFKIGYDADYADCSPGQLLMQHTLRHARAAGLERYELQGTTAEWTRMWGCTEHPSSAVRVHRWRPVALAAAGARALQRFGHRIF